MITIELHPSWPELVLRGSAEDLNRCAEALGIDARADGDPPAITITWPLGGRPYEARRTRVEQIRAWAAEHVEGGARMIDPRTGLPVEVTP